MTGLGTHKLGKRCSKANKIVTMEHDLGILGPAIVGIVALIPIQQPRKRKASEPLDEKQKNAREAMKRWIRDRTTPADYFADRYFGRYRRFTMSLYNELRVYTNKHRCICT